MARASPALYARTMANTPESAHTPANRRQPDSPEQRDGQHPAATRPPAPVATPGAVRNGGALLFPVTSMSRSSGRRLPKAEQVALRRRRGAVRITPEDRTRPRRTAVERAWLIECRTLEAVAYVRSQVAQLMRELDGAVLSDRWQRAH